MAAAAFLSPGRQLIQANPTFEAMEHYAQAAGAEVVSVRLTSQFAHDLGQMLQRAGNNTGLVYVCNPNNPTASLTPRADLEVFIEKLPANAHVLIDEAYHHYATQSARYASFIDRPLGDKRVIVSRTFSKVYGLAGLRLGYAVGDPTVLQRMGAHATERNVNCLAAAAAMAALEDTESVHESVARNANDRQEFRNQAMVRMLKPIDSHANFLMMDTHHHAQEVIQHFQEHKVLIGRRFSAMDSHIRVSLGTPAEMLEFWRVWDLLHYTQMQM
jgi:histidinol-phosphate aminotransferase